MSEQIVPGTLYVVSTPIGNLGDITRRAVEVVSGVGCIAAAREVGVRDMPVGNAS